MKAHLRHICRNSLERFTVALYMASKIDKQRAAISKRLKELRVERGYTSYEKFANEHELDRKQYWRIEENQTNFTINSLLRILEIHQIPLQDFFKDI